MTGCPEQALELARRPEWRQPAPEVRDIGAAILKARGRARDILPYIKPDADPLGEEDNE